MDGTPSVMTEGHSSPGRHVGYGAHRLFLANSDSLLYFRTPGPVARREPYALTTPPRAGMLQSSEQATTPGHEFSVKETTTRDKVFHKQERLKETGISGSQKKENFINFFGIYTVQMTDPDT